MLLVVVQRPDGKKNWMVHDQLLVFMMCFLVIYVMFTNSFLCCQIDSFIEECFPAFSAPRLVDTRESSSRAVICFEGFVLLRSLGLSIRDE